MAVQAINSEWATRVAQLLREADLDEPFSSLTARTSVAADPAAHARVKPYEDAT